MKILGIMVDSVSGDDDFADRYAEIEELERLLKEASLSDSYGSFMPQIPSTDDEDMRLALAACHMRGMYNKDKEAGVFTLTAAGDTTFGQYPEVDPETCFESELSLRGGDLSFPLSLCAPFFKTDDLSVLNCEGTFTESVDAMEKLFRFKGRSEYASMFINGGVELVNLANNHSFDYKERGLQDTYDTLDSYGIKYFNDNIICYRDTAVGKAAFIGYEIHAAEPDMEPLLKRDVKTARDQGAEIIIVTFHWGYEYHKYACKYQEDIGRLAVDMGADLVLGHHPHVMQGIEVYKGRAIVYSLGNFAFGGDEEVPNKETFIFRQTFIKGAEGVEPGKIQIIPCYISSVEGRNNYTPIPLFGREADDLMDELKKRSSVHDYGLLDAQYLKTTAE